MPKNRLIQVLAIALVLSLAACSRQQSDWQKTRETNSIEAYDAFLKKYPTGEFTAQAQAQLKQLEEERDWAKARDTDTLDAYQAFLKQYPEGRFTEEARIRVENFTLAQAPGAAPGADASTENAASAAPIPPAAPKPAPAAAPAPTPVAPVGKAGTGGHYGVQLGAFKANADAANKHWIWLQQKYPKVLAGLSPRVSPKKESSGTLYRLQVANLSEKRARSLCKSLTASSQACVVLKP
jgi:cell division septation protein DedD